MDCELIHGSECQGSRQNFCNWWYICIINDLGGLVNYTCVSYKFMIVAMQRSEAKQKLVKGQPTLFDE